MGSREAQLDMLARVLAAGESDVGVENLAEGDDVPGGGKPKLNARRVKGSMGALTGAQGRLYMVSCLPQYEDQAAVLRNKTRPCCLAQHSAAARLMQCWLQCRSMRGGSRSASSLSSANMRCSGSARRGGQASPCGCSRLQAWLQPVY